MPITFYDSTYTTCVVWKRCDYSYKGRSGIIASDSFVLTFIYKNFKWSDI